MIEELRQAPFDYNAEPYYGWKHLVYRHMVSFESKQSYVGEWIVNQDIMEGRGKTIYPTGSIYEG